MGERGRYLYAVSRGLDAADLRELRGLVEAPVECVSVGDLVGIVSSVDLDDYGEEGLRRNLERLDWLEAAARGHDSVVQTVASVAPTAPMRLATIFRDDDGVRTRITDQYDAICAVLDRVEGHEEWSVKVLTPTPDPAAVPSEPAASGAEYLRRRRAEQEAREDGVRDAHVVAEQVHSALAPLATGSRRLQPQDPRLTGHTGTMVLNAVYLVPAERSLDFAIAVGEQTAAHSEVTVDARGPWPPYSFAMLEDV